MKPSPALVRSSRYLCAVSVFVSVSLYIYNTTRMNADTFRGDQWYWITNVVIPWEDGRLTLFDAVTSEYASLSHSHIPTLIVFLINYRWLGLNTTIDSVVGVLSLLAVGVILFAYTRATMSGRVQALAMAAVASILFMASSYTNFIWSLLQFQMFYILVAVAYLYYFSRQLHSPKVLFAVLAMPAVLIAGDAIGVAAVVAGLAYLALLVVLREVSWRKALPFFLAFPIQLLVLSSLLTGTRQHGDLPWSDFLRSLKTDPSGFLKSIYFALSTAFVGLNDGSESLAILEWNFALFWFAITLISIGFAAIGLRYSKLAQRNHFPLLLIATGGIWTLGVIKSRSWLLGAESTQAPRYAAYTSLVGLGLLLLVFANWQSLARWRGAFAIAMVVVIGANTAGSIAVSIDDEGPKRRDKELKSLTAYVNGEVDQPVQTGFQCKPASPCLEAAWFLSDHQLGPFSDNPAPRDGWLAEFRQVSFADYRSLSAEDQARRCDAIATDSDRKLNERLFSDGTDSLSASLTAAQVVVPNDEQTTAVQNYRRAIESLCLEGR